MNNNILKKLARDVNKRINYNLFLELRYLFVHQFDIKFKNIKKVQYGGKIKKYTIENQKYYVDIEKSLIDDNNDNEYEISFMSLQNENTVCGIMLINNITKEAIIQDIGNMEYCVTDINSKDIKKKGYIIMNIMIHICKKNNISKILLSDNSYYTCENNSKHKIQLIYGRTLTHCLPYYTKFGFRPVFDTSKKILKKNYKLIKTVKVKNINLIKIIKKVITQNVELKKYIKLIPVIDKKLVENKDDLLIDFLKYFMDKYCDLFYYTYLQIFQKLKLEMYLDKKFQLKL